MTDKGYDFPLYSLHRIDGDLPGAAPALPVAGRAQLVVSDALLRQAAELSTGACEDLVARALVALRLRPEALARLGFDEAWGRSLRHWRGRMVAQELAVRAAAAAVRGQGTGALVEEGRRLWSRLALSARLAGCAAVVRGSAPKQAAALCAALGEVVARARAQAAALAARGFDAEDLAALARLREALAAEVAARPGRRWTRGDVAGPLLVLRGALLGDVKLLAPAARQLLPPRHRRLLSLRAALRRRGSASPHPRAERSRRSSPQR